MDLKSELLMDMAGSQRYLVTRPQLIELGFSSSSIQRMVESGRLLARGPGVYQVDGRPQNWYEKLELAVLAAGEGSLASHRSAMKLWNLDGPSRVPVEITVAFGHLPVPKDVILHRTRRVRDANEADGIPVTTVNRTLLDCAALLPAVMVAKAVDSAVRQKLATVDKLARFVAQRGGRGVRGTRRLRHVLDNYSSEMTTGSPAEAEALYHLRKWQIVEPVLQYEFFTRNGRRVPDFYWPDLNKAVEIDGLETHSSADALDDDLERQNDLLELGIELRRFSARQVRRNPRRFVDDIRRFLSS